MYILEDIRRPSTPEIQKFLLFMKGYSKSRANCEWMKEMLNWDLFTHPKADSFARNTSNKEKVRLATQWKDFMDTEDIFISFYEWKNQQKIFPKTCSKNIIKPQTTSPICCSVQTLSISDLGREIGRLKKSIKEHETTIE